MEPKHMPFVAFGASDISPQAPRLALEVKGNPATYQGHNTFNAEDPDHPYMTVTMPYFLDIAIRRLPAGDDNDKRTMVFRFDPDQHIFDGAQLVLLRVTGHGLERVEVPRLDRYCPDPDSVFLDDGHARLSIHELDPGGIICLKSMGELTSNYLRLLQAGEKYELIWPGGTVSMWRWGKKQDYCNNEVRQPKELNSNKSGEVDKILPRLIIPATEVGGFTARLDEETWPDRLDTGGDDGFMRANRNEWEWRGEQQRRLNSPPPIAPLEIISGGPILTMRVECPSEWRPGDVMTLTKTVTYEGAANGEDPKPITFRTAPLHGDINGRTGTRMYRLYQGNWVRHCTDWEENPCYAGFLEGDITLRVGDENDQVRREFTTLWPGESWSVWSNVSDRLPADAKYGEQLNFFKKGPWWIGGTGAPGKTTEIR